MKDTEKELKAVLSKHFSGQKQRLVMMSKLLLCILKLGTISYSKLSLALNSEVARLSNFKRIQRFVKEYKFCDRSYVQLVWHLIVKSNNWVVLSIDRTNWKFGKSNINILLIGISYKGIAIPLVWQLLDKRGNSSFAERQALLDRLCSLLDQHQLKQVHYLVADREFIGVDWLSYLKSLDLTFVIRIKSNVLMRKMGKINSVRVGDYFNCCQFKALRKKRILFGHQLYVGGQKAGTKERLILISNRPIAKAKRLYKERWAIEVFFAACKRRGFNLEDTHVTQLTRLFNLIFLLALAFLWAIKTGEEKLKNGQKVPLKRIKQAAGYRVAKLYSLFRVGLDSLREKLLHHQPLNRQILLLSCT
jgi:hypothetical protein